MIFGKRGIFYRLILVHLLNTFSLSYLLRLIGALVASVLRSRHEARVRTASTGSQILRKIYGHIVAQRLGAEKLTARWDDGDIPRRGVSAVSHLGMASVIVLLVWFYWPAEAAAPEQPLVASSSVTIATTPPSISALENAPTQPEAPISPRQIADTKERFAALTTDQTSPDSAAPAVAPARPVLTDLERANSLLQPEGGIDHGVVESEASSVPYPGDPGPVSRPDVTLGPSRPDGLSELLLTLTEALSHRGQIGAGTDEGQRDPAVAPTPEPVVAPPPPTPLPERTLVPGPQWANFIPATAPAVDHYWLDQPHPTGYNQFYSPNYQFGSTANGRYRIHHGVDIANETGSPVLAMGEGEVVHAGPDNPALLGPYNNFYGNAVVIRLNRRLPTPEGEQDVYVVLGHMSEVYVERGQQVTPDVVVGAVGMTGIAIGPHLHVEVRVGQNSYLHSVNPALWIRNPPGAGSVAVRLVTADNRSWPLARLSLLRYEGGSSRWVRTFEIYPDAENIRPDPAWGENGALSNLAAGSYWIGGVINGEKVGQNITIYSGETTFVELRTQQ